jgi:transcriptional regulator with XRE-family HTH domain
MPLKTARAPKDRKVPSELALRITALRGAMTKRAFAKLCSVEYTDLWRYERHNVVPSAEVLVRIARACGVRVEWLATGETPKRTSTRAA